jgi:hypothetical protein
MTDVDEKGTCFVIAPIGEEESETRERADKVMDYVIIPAVGECGYTAIRADRISEPGIITSQVIQHLVEDPLVVADLTDHNPNVFYELAVRHAVRKPVVHIIEVSQTIPFDVVAMRTISLDHRDLESADRCRQDIVQQIKAIEAGTTELYNPVSQAVDLQSLRGSGNPLEKSTADIISTLQEVRVMVGDLQSFITLPRRPSGAAGVGAPGAVPRRPDYSIYLEGLGEYQAEVIKLLALLELSGGERVLAGLNRLAPDRAQKLARRNGLTEFVFEPGDERPKLLRLTHEGRKVAQAYTRSVRSEP